MDARAPSGRQGIDRPILTARLLCIRLVDVALKKVSRWLPET
jgi:hypothetical protein